MKHPLQDLLDLHREVFHPIMGFWLDKKNTQALNFTASNDSLQEVNLKNTAEFDRYVFEKLIPNSKQAGAGGYFEPRVLYSRSEHFGGKEPRTTHLGIDVWMRDGSPVYAPLDGVIHSFADNAGFGNYGPTLILEHQLESQPLYLLLGHLALANIPHWRRGQRVKKGEKVGNLGPFPENGDWPAHVHVQLMSDLMGHMGDFPGVCSPSEEGKFRNLILDPKPMLGSW